MAILNLKEFLRKEKKIDDKKVFETLMDAGVSYDDPLLKETMKSIQGQIDADSITRPEHVWRMMRRNATLKVENFWGIYLDNSNNPIKVKRLATGLVNRVLINPTELFRPAILRRAQGVIMVHNHPSGKTDPSDEDIRITKAMKQAGDVLGIKLLDHIIIAKHGFYSFQGEGEL